MNFKLVYLFNFGIFRVGYVKFGYLDGRSSELSFSYRSLVLVDSCRMSSGSSFSNSRKIMQNSMRNRAEDCPFNRDRGILGCPGPKPVICLWFTLETDLCLVNFNTICSSTKAFLFYWCTIRSLQCLRLPLSVICLLD